MTFTLVTSGYTSGALDAKLMTVTSNENESTTFKHYSTSTEQKMFGFNEKSEILQGRLAMLGIVAAVGAYALTGQIIPGIW